MIHIRNTDATTIYDTARYVKLVMNFLDNEGGICDTLGSTDIATGYDKAGHGGMGHVARGTRHIN